MAPYGGNWPAPFQEIRHNDQGKYKSIGKMLEIADIFKVWDGVSDTDWDTVIKDSRLL